MNWKIAEAKQHFSDVVRQASEAPQIILNRDRPVAAVIAADELQEFLTWRARRHVRPLAEALADARRICEEENYTLHVPARRNRPNPLLKGAKRVPRGHERHQ